MPRMGKKGVTVMQLGQVAMLIVLIGATIGIGVWINDEMITTAYDTTAVVNETVTFTANNTFYDLVYKAASISSITNQSDEVDFADTLDAPFYETRDYGFITQMRVFYNASFTSGTPDYNVSYTSYQSDAHYATVNATSGISNLAQWMPIIAIIIAASVIVSALALWFGRR